MMFSDGKWNYVLHPGSGKRIVRAVRPLQPFLAHPVVTQVDHG